MNEPNGGLPRTRGHRYSAERLAEYCHDQTIALQRLQERNGERVEFVAEPWASFPAEYQRITIEGVERVRRGTSVREHQHAWIEAMAALGWTRGPEDRENKTRPDLVEYDEMNQFQRDKVRMFMSAVITLTLEE
jgi:hypothetical protein